MKIEIKCTGSDMLPLDFLEEFQGGLKKRTNTDIKKIKTSIKKYGFSFPFFVWQNGGKNWILDGHGRLEALVHMRNEGFEVPLLPVVYVEAVSEEEAKQKLLRMNSQYGTMSLDSVIEFMGDIDFNFEELQLPSGETLKLCLEEEFENEGKDGEIEENAEPKVKRGEIWQLGNHRLMCGDSTLPEDVEQLMNGEKADMVFTDPPYGMKKEKDGVLNDNLNYDDLLDFNREWIPNTFNNLKDNGSWYCWGIDEPLMDIYSNILKPMAKDNEITFRNLITWDKGNGQGQSSSEFRMYPIADEKCLFVMCGEQDMKYKRNLQEFNEIFEPIRQYFEKERKASGLSVEKISEIDSTRCSHYWARVQFEFPTREAYIKIQDYCQKNGINAFSREYDELKQEYDELKQEFYKGRSFFDNTHDNMNNVWHFDRTSQDERSQTGGHATPKPIALCSRAIKSSSREEEIVLDVFGGSGSTLIACENLNRKCYMMELEEHYCDVIINRWETRTGLKAVKL